MERRHSRHHLPAAAAAIKTSAALLYHTAIIGKWHLGFTIEGADKKGGGKGKGKKGKAKAAESGETLALYNLAGDIGEKDNLAA